MNVLKIFPNLLLSEKIEKVHLVASKSQPGIYYRVGEDKDGNMQCECNAYFMSREPKTCKHIQLVKLKKDDTI